MKEIIGSLEKVSLPELALFGLDAKVDTGADSSALHCDNIQDHGEMVHFTLCDEVHPSYNGKSFTLPIAKRIKVKSSNGISSERIFISTTILLNGKEIETLVSLTDRKKLKYPMLLGKRFLKGLFLVDVSYTYIYGE